MDKKTRRKIDKVRASRDGHEFHEAWAARKALQLVMPTDGLVGIAVEGLSPADLADASTETVEIADLVLYYGKRPTFDRDFKVVIYFTIIGHLFETKIEFKVIEPRDNRV